MRLFLIAALSLCAFAQEGYGQGQGPATKHRQTIGLALEGGGALGLAHVGLLQYLEQHHIPVDYIAGSSMGGLVAGFYASGMTAAEMQTTVDGLNWQRLVNGVPDDRRLSFRRKDDVRTFGNETILGLRNGLVIPTGLNNGQGLNLLLSKVALPYSQMSTFDNLPTPYRTVATDVIAAHEYVFDKGSLAKAMRATMSIPALFDPVIDGDRELVDGGLLNNMPVDLVKQMGADIVIAVYLKTDRLNAHDPQTAFDVLGRSLSAVISANEQHNIEAADLLVTVNCSGLTTMSFKNYQMLIQRGFEGGEKKRVMLDKLAIDEPEWTEYQKERQAKRRTTVGKPEFVEVTGVEGSMAGNVRSYFVADIGVPVDPEAIESQIGRIMGTNMFAYINYEAVVENGRPGLHIYVHQSPSKPPTLQPAFLVDGSDYRNTRFTAAARLTMLNFGGFRSELRTDFVAGSTYAVRTEWFHPFTPLGNWFVAPRAVTETRPFDIYRRSQLLSLYRERNSGGGIDFGYSFGNSAELRFGYESSHVASVFRLGEQSIYPIVQGRYGASRVEYTLDRLDDEIVPHAGEFLRADMRWIDSNPGTTKRLPVLDGIAAYFYPLTEKTTFTATAQGGTTFGRDNSGLPLFYLGGPLRLSAYGLNELYGNQYLLGRVGYRHQIGVLSPITGSRAFFVAEYEVGKMYGFANETRLPMDANAGILVDTLLGPLFVGGSAGDAGHRKWYFEIGRYF